VNIIFIISRIVNKMRSLIASLYFNGYGVKCCLCGKRSGRYIPYRGGRRPALIAALDVVGSDVKKFSCPRCGCSDRARHLYLYLERLGLWDKFRGANILHFAPENALSLVIESKAPARWVRADLFPLGSDIEKIDIQSIPYDDNSFDIVIANHVLEHVSDDNAALRELHRVLKPQGLAIIQTPFSAKLEHTFCDTGVDTESARLQAFGQEDHVRLYGKDIFKRIESHGFLSHVAFHDKVLPDINTAFFGVNKKEPLFLFEKSIKI